MHQTSGNSSEADHGAQPMVIAPRGPLQAAHPEVFLRSRRKCGTTNTVANGCFTPSKCLLHGRADECFQGLGRACPGWQVGHWEGVLGKRMMGKGVMAQDPQEENPEIPARVSGLQRRGRSSERPSQPSASGSVAVSGWKWMTAPFRRRGKSPAYQKFRTER